MSKQTTPLAALRGIGLAATGAALAASAWAGGGAEPGLMLDERLWREEVVASADGWEEEGWYQLTVAAGSVQVRAARPHCGDAGVAADAMYLHIPGAQLPEGLRVNHAFPGDGLRPVVGRQYSMALGRTDFSFAVDSSAAGTEYVIRYGGATYRYLLGLPAAATRVHAIADLDADHRPDFVVEVGGELFLLLSSQARPGTNLPSAQLWAAAQ